MTTNNTNSSTTKKQHDLAYQQQYGNFNVYDNESLMNRKSDDFDKMDDDSDETQIPVLFKAIDEHNLSQKMSHLSMQITTDNDNESLLKDIQIDIEKIPDYLTKRNKSLRQIINQILATIKINDNDKIEDLGKIAILIYKIMVIQTYQLLWTAYLKSGVGQLINQPQKQLVTYPTNLPIWPKEIKTMVQATTTMKINEENEYECCFIFVQRYLQVLEDQLKKYQSDLKLKMNHFQGYSSKIERPIEMYIEQNLQCLRMEIEHKIELIHYDYLIQALKLEYFRHQPNKYQEQLMKEICQSKYEQETTEQELNFLKKQIHYYNSPSQSFECSPIAQSTLIDSIQNPSIRQQLFKQYKEVAEQARANMFTLYMTTAEEQRDEYKKKYDTNQKKMMDAYRSPIGGNEKIDSIMLGLIHECCQKISERIQCVYKFKIQSIVSNSKS